MTKNWLKTNNWGLKQRFYSFGWLIENEEFFQERVYYTDQHDQSLLFLYLDWYKNVIVSCHRKY